MDNFRRFFILGNPRSGTSLFRLMLNSHPNIVVPPESGFMHWWWSKYRNWSYDESKINGVIKDFLSSRKIETWHLSRELLINSIKQCKPNNYQELSSLIYLNYSGTDFRGIKAIGDKNNYYINHIEDLSQIWIDAYFIHIVRDVRDVYCSYNEVVNLNTSSEYKPKLSNNPIEVANEWVDNNSKIENLKLGIAKYHLIRYEDLIYDTVNTLEIATKFLGIEYNDEMLEYYQGKDEPKETLDWKRKTQEKPDLNKVGRHKKELSIEIIEEINQVAKIKLADYGYL